MEAIVKLNKEDLNQQILTYLSRSGFKLIDGKEIDWRFRPSLHVMMDVTSAGVEDWQKLVTSELQSSRAEMMSRGYIAEARLLDQVLDCLAMRAKGDTPVITTTPIETKLRDSVRPPPVSSETDTSVDDQLQEIIAASRNLQKGEYKNDPRENSNLRNINRDDDGK